MRFTRSALQAGHSVSQIFFFQDAAACAALPPSDPLGTALKALAEHCSIVACVSAAERRGVTTAETPFELVGLGSLIEASALADRHLTFA